MKMIKMMNFLFPLSFVATLLGGCGDSETSKEKKNVINMGTCADNPPFEYHDTSLGDDVIIGADIDIAEALADEMGMKLDIKDLEFNSLVPAMQAGRVDFVMALMTPTEERKKNISFSDAYFISRIAVVTGKQVQIDSKKDFIGKKIGVQLGTTNEQVARELATQVKDMEIVSLNKLGELIQEIRAGRLDGVLMEATPAKAYAEANDDLNYNVIEDLQSTFAVAFPKDSMWVDKFNAGLKKLKAQGKLDIIMAKWVKE